MIYIGIDPGVNTGIAVWDSRTKQFESVVNMTIAKALGTCSMYRNAYPSTQIFMEDARLRKWFGKSGREQLQGAGSIKRDCGIWEEVFPDIVKVAPKNNRTKLDAATFAKITGWKDRTSVHARDAAMLVYGK